MQPLVRSSVAIRRRIVYVAGGGEPARFEMTEDRSSGTWSYAGETAWNRWWYQYEVTVFVRQTGRIDAAARSQNHPGRHALTGIFSREEGGRYLDAVALLSNQSCTDGISDRAYGFRVDLILGNTEGFDLLSGCCTLAN